MAKMLQILMPMGGLGSRFSKEGFVTPKPLIPVDGVPMFRRAIASFDGIEAPKTFTFVIRQEHVDHYKLDELITQALPEAVVVVIPELTRGAAETAAMAYPRLSPDDPVVIMDCDFAFTSQAYAQMVTDVLAGKSEVGGGLLTFESQDPRYSYAATGPDGYVTRTAEKQVISSHAIWGAYFFTAARTFADATEELMRRPLSETMKEYYISFVYGLLLERGEKILSAPVDEFHSFGTPEELDAYVGHHVEPC
jgi:NDP-sugar pyrophosphorylase family protein